MKREIPLVLSLLTSPPPVRRHQWKSTQISYDAQATGGTDRSRNPSYPTQLPSALSAQLWADFTRERRQQGLFVVLFE
jgi:hypothetical protein